MDFWPHSDKGRTLNYEDCTETIIALTNEMLIVIVLDTLNSVDRNIPGNLEYRNP